MRALALSRFSGFRRRPRRRRHSMPGRRRPLLAGCAAHAIREAAEPCDSRWSIVGGNLSRPSAWTATAAGSWISRWPRPRRWRPRGFSTAPMRKSHARAHPGFANSPHDGPGAGDRRWRRHRECRHPQSDRRFYGKEGSVPKAIRSMRRGATSYWAGLRQGSSIPSPRSGAARGSPRTRACTRRSRRAA